MWLIIGILVLFFIYMLLLTTDNETIYLYDEIYEEIDDKKLVKKMKKIRVCCNMCPKCFNSTEAFENHWKDKHLLNWGWNGAYPTIWLYWVSR